MLKSDIKALIASKMMHLPEKTIDASVENIIAILTEAIVSGQTIEIRNFGSFHLNITQPRLAHNPKTGEKIMTVSSRKIRFKPGKGLREGVNNAKIDIL